MLLWFRNDLRTHDNPALADFLAQRSQQAHGANASNNPSKAIFFISEKQWRNHDWSSIKIDFVMRHAHALITQLKALNIELSLIKIDSFEQQIDYLSDYCRQHKISQVLANAELEYNEVQRDHSCLAKGIPLKLFEADVIVPKGKVLNKSGKMFKVFTPFKRAWLSYVQVHGFDYLGKPATTCADNLNEDLVDITDDISDGTSDDISDGITGDTVDETNKNCSRSWPLASQYEQEVLANFLSEKLADYASCRDIPSIKATSGISPYLAAGVISPRYVLRLLLTQQPDLLSATDSREFAWLNELIWREFYRHLMFDQPRLCKHQCFNEKYQNRQWPNNAALFAAWCEGKTGYPLVDAAMRQLNQTGWMHNRLRMVVASFLTKHLLIDWRWGEKYFMQHLIDGDLAANNGGWQWAASTGCDAQPYFRIFNPIRQSERFDPNGDFIRKYLPELVNIPNKNIHFPHKYIKEHQLAMYFSPIVEHKTARLAALDFYK